MEVTRTPRRAPAACRSRVTWMHSSRVGTTTSACGRVPVAPGLIRCSSGTPKPRVLPVPVRAWPIRSVPASAIGRVISWIAKVRAMPTSASARTMGSPTARSAKRGLSSRTGARPASGSNSSVSGVSAASWGRVWMVDVSSFAVSAVASLATRRRPATPGGFPLRPLDARRGGAGGRRDPKRAESAHISLAPKGASHPLSYPYGCMSARAPILEAPLTSSQPLPSAVGREAVVDLLGGLAYGELTAFDRIAEDARLAPTLSGRAALAGMAAAEIGHFERLRERLTELGVDPEEAMRPFVAVFDRFHELTAPSTWLEGLIKAYVGDAIAADFYREVAEFLDPETRALVLDVLADTGHADFALREVRAAIDADPALRDRLALWARRLVGEALS